MSWAEVNRNFFWDPNYSSGSSAAYGVINCVSARVGGAGFDGSEDARRFTVTSTGSAVRISQRIKWPTPGGPISVRWSVYVPTPRAMVTVTLRRALTSGTGAVPVFAGPIEAGWTTFVYDGPAPPTDLADTGIALTLAPEDAITTETYMISGALCTPVSPAGPFFCGATPNTPTERYSWIGVANESVSIQEHWVNDGAPSIADLEMSWFSARSGLTPAGFFTVRDHKRAFFKNAVGGYFADPQIQTTDDLAQMFYRVGAPDLPPDSYVQDKYDYYSTVSGLTPRLQFSLADHMRKYFLDNLTPSVTPPTAALTVDGLTGSFNKILGGEAVAHVDTNVVPDANPVLQASLDGGPWVSYWALSASGPMAFDGSWTTYYDAPSFDVDEALAVRVRTLVGGVEVLSNVVTMTGV